MNFSDVLIIVIVLVAAGIAAMIYFNKKAMRKMIETQDFIDANRVTTQIFVIDKQYEKPTEQSLPKGAFEQLSPMARMRKMCLVRAKVGPQVVTLMCEKNVYDVLTVKKNVKVELAGIFIVKISGMNLEDKKKKTFREKMALQANKEIKK
ncbi:MAG: hypothetical protein R3Y53_00735 [Bacillota bacterium]